MILQQVITVMAENQIQDMSTVAFRCLDMSEMVYISRNCGIWVLEIGDKCKSASDLHKCYFDILKDIKDIWTL